MPSLSPSMQSPACARSLELELEDRLAIFRQEMQADLARLQARLELVEQLGAVRVPEANPQLLEVCATFETSKVAQPSQPQGDEPVAGAPIEETTEVYFEESVWSFPLLIGLVDVGCFDRFFTATLLLLNICMQIAFTCVLLSDGFMGEAFDTEIDNARVWRTSVAHDAKYLDLKD